MSRDTSKRPDGSLYEMYRCKGAGCEKRAVISLDLLDEHVCYLVSELSAGILRGKPQGEGGEATQLEKELQTVQHEIEEAVEAFSTAGVSPVTQAKALALLEARKTDVESRLAALETPTAFEVPEALRHEMALTPQGLILRGATLQEALYRPDVDGNGFLRGALERVEVKPGRGRVWERSEVTFRGPEGA
jgi:hypothetical protein